MYLLPSELQICSWNQHLFINLFFFSPTKGYCQPYRGMTCANFIGNNSIYVTDYQAQGDVEDTLTSAFLVIMHDLSNQCQEFAIPSLCYFAFPFCDSTAEEPRGRELCRDECEILELDVCQKEYAIASEYPGVTLPNCKQLPQIGTKESENCIRIGIPSVKAVTGTNWIPWQFIQRQSMIFSRERY